MTARATSSTPLTDLGLTLPVLGAPMAGGPTTPDLVIAVADAGGLGMLAAGYRTLEDLAEQVEAVRRRTWTYGVNLFAPNPVPVDPAAYAAYRTRLLPLADLLGVALPERPREDDDAWEAKLDLLCRDPAPVVSFTFGVPTAREVGRLRTAGSVTVQTVTTAAEARLAEEAGVDMLLLQAYAAGGHSGTLTPATPPADLPLPDLVRRVASATHLPLVAAGGLSGPDDVRAALAAGASAVAVGTALLLAPEAGTSPVHRTALTEPDRRTTVVTRAFSGRPARSLVNRFVEQNHAHAPAGYPAVHHLTTPLRRAATAAGEGELVSLWAGAGHRLARERPASEIVAGLVRRL